MTTFLTTNLAHALGFTPGKKSPLEGVKEALLARAELALDPAATDAARKLDAFDDSTATRLGLTKGETLALANGMELFADVAGRGDIVEGDLADLTSFRHALERFAANLNKLGDESTGFTMDAAALAALQSEAERSHGLLISAIAERDLAALQHLAQQAVGTHGEQNPLTNGLGRLAPGRFSSGDRVAYRRDDGKLVEGFVLRQTQSFAYMERLVDGGKSLTQDQRPLSALLPENPIPIGWYVPNVPGFGEVWSDGVNDAGEFVVQARSRPDEPKRRLSAAEVQEVIAAFEPLFEEQAVGSIRFPLELLTEAGKEVAKAGPPERPAPGAPVDRQVSRGVSLDAPAAIDFDTCSVAMVLDAGPPRHGQPRPQEDALFVGRRLHPERGEYVLGIASDEAGSGGKVEGETGPVSHIVVSEGPAILDALLQGKEPPLEVLAAALKRAQSKLEASPAAKVDAYATFFGLIIDDARRAYWMSVGDSPMFHVRAGRLTPTPRQNEGYLLAKAHGPSAGLGHYHEITASVRAYVEIKALSGTLDLEPDDYLVVCSDGLADANEISHHVANNRGEAWTFTGDELTEEHIAEMLTQGPEAAAAAHALRAYVKQFVESGRGKPDNVTILVFRIGHPTRPAPDASLVTVGQGT